MSERKYQKYVVTEDIRSSLPPSPAFLKRLEDQRKAGNYTDSDHVLRLNDLVAEGALYFDAVWMVDKHGEPPTNIEIGHTHDFDEIIGFFGNRQDGTKARELGGEVEIWLEDEQYILTTSSIIYAPRGLQHGPISFRKINTPILFFTMGNGTSYTRATGSEE